VIENGQIVTKYTYMRHVEQILIELITTWSTQTVDDGTWACEVITMQRITYESGNSDTRQAGHKKFESANPQIARRKFIRFHRKRLNWLGM